MKYILLSGLIFFGTAANSSCQLLTGADTSPVRVSHFTAEQNNNKTSLNWKVVCYLQYANFEVQRSTNATDYITISNFTADRLRCLSPFNFVDEKTSGKVYYRLRIGDKDGKFSTSKVIVAFGKEKSFEINSITPSLIAKSTLLSISSAEKDVAAIYILNMEGFLVKRLTTSLNKGTTDIKIDLSNLPKGIYVIKIANSFSDFRTSRIAKL